MKRSIVTLLGVVGVSALALTGCTGGGDGEAASDSVTYALTGDPGQLNPIKNATVAAQSLAAFGYESLVSFAAGADPQGCSPRSGRSRPPR